MIWGIVIGAVCMLILVFLLVLAFATGRSVGVQQGAEAKEQELRVRYPLDALDQAHVELEEESRAASVEDEAMRRAEEALRRAGPDAEGKL